MGHLPHFTMLLISAVSGLAGTTREHLGLALALDVPIIIIVNKIDLASTEMLENTISSLESLLKSAACKKVYTIIYFDYSLIEFNLLGSFEG